MNIFRLLFLLFLITFCNITYGQVLEFKLVLQDGIYNGSMSPDFFDSLVIYPSDNRKNALLNSTGVLYNSQKGNFEFGIVENNIDETSDLIIKVSFGWFPLTNVEEFGDSLKFSWDWDYRPAPGKHDLEILKKTNKILKNESSWNNNDDRECKDDDANKSWSLYCALYKASVDVMGDFNHRNPAMEMVRTTINEVTPEKEYRHRLMDFNNQNTFAEIKELLNRSIEKLENILNQN